jgi:ADP-heptose:LPS heptosyltransferase
MEFFLDRTATSGSRMIFCQKQTAGKKILGVHVGSGGTKNLPLKRWPLKNYAGLVRQLNKERPDIHILLFGGPEEAKDHQVVLAQANRI